MLVKLASLALVLGTTATLPIVRTLATSAVPGGVPTTPATTPSATSPLSPSPATPGAPASAALGTTVVTYLAPSSNTTPGVWYRSTVTAGGQVSTTDLTGAGGDLETNAPLPVGAALLETFSDDQDRANIGVLDDYGRPDDIFSTLEITYSWHKASNPGQNLAAAPSLKLAFYDPVCDDPLSAGDCYGQLIYEPTWNGVGATSPNGPSTSPALDTWTTVTIDEDNGLFWWTGGFGQPSSAGGPPVRTLAEWRALLSSDFGQSELVLVELGVGSYNREQIGYVDDVRISHGFGGGYDASYDFEPFVGEDCNENGVPDDVDISSGTSADCNGNGVPDECDVATSLPAHASFTDFEAAGFVPGVSVDCLAPEGSPAAPCVSGTSPSVQAWSVRDATDEEVVDLSGSDPAHGKVWRISDLGSDGNLQTRPHAPRWLGQSGETGAIDDFGGEAVTSDGFWARLDFRSASGGPQPGLAMNFAAACGDDCRHGFVRVTDDGAGFDLEFFETGDNSGTMSCGTFPLTVLDLDLSYTEWHTLEIEILFVDGFGPGGFGAEGNDVVNVYVDGALVHTGTSWETCYAFVGSGAPRSVDRLVVYQASDGASAAGGGLYVDDVLISDERLVAASEDCNGNGVPDECDVTSGTSADCDMDGVPDECQTDCNANGFPDACDLASGTSLDCNGNGVPDECDVAAGTSADCDGDLVPDECEPDCNDNGVADDCDVAGGTSADCNANGVPDECEPDCNGNGVPDDCDVAGGTSADCNGNGTPDECEPDCNGNGVPDDCDVLFGTALDCNGNLVPDECDFASGTSFDCNGNGILDECDIALGIAQDCNANGVPDTCDLAGGASADCNGNGIPDECDIAAGTSADCQPDGIPDECQPDCNANGTPDDCDLAAGTSADCNANAVPDECDIAAGTSLDCQPDGIPDECQPDCNANGTPDDCDLAGGTSADCNGNGVPDECDLAAGTSADCQPDGIPDECQPDCNANGVPDDCDLAAGTSADCNANAVPDECDVAAGTSLDCQPDGVPDECQPDCNANGVPDDCDLAAGTSADCNANAVPDECDVATHTSRDCNGNGIPDECDLAAGTSADCNGNGVPDECDVAQGPGQTSFDQGFETDLDGWDVFSPAFLGATRVASGTDGVTSATGGWHAVAPSDAGGTYAAGNWGGYACNPGCAATACAAGPFPAAGYETAVAVWLDVGAGYPNDSRFDFSSAISRGDGSHLRDFIFSVGFYDASDGTGPGAGTDRFVVSVSNNAPGFPKGGQAPAAIGSTGWYTFRHRFYDDGGVLACEMSIDDAGGTPVYSTVRPGAPTDVIDGVTVGGNRYGWFVTNDFPFLAFDDAHMSCGLEGSADCNGNGVPDECETDCNGNGVPDDCDIAAGTSLDCQPNGIPDECDIASGTSTDFDGNGVPDECKPDCNGNGIPDFLDLLFGASEDCNGNGVPDECDVASGTSPDLDGNGIPDECDPGTASCFGVGCPCGNDDATAGCANSTGSGGLLSGSGSTSVTADDLVLTATGLPIGQQGLFYMGDTVISMPLWDGRQCALGTTFRFLASVQNTGATGTMTFTGLVAEAPGLIVSGTTWHFHGWHRDVPGTPCGTGANFTSLYSVSFTP